MSLTFAPGTHGRVRDGSSILAGLFKWSIQKSLQMIQTPHFEVTADANGVPWMPQALYGFANATVEIGGSFDVGDNSETSLYIGKAVVLDLYFSKTLAFGPENLRDQLRHRRHQHAGGHVHGQSDPYRHRHARGSHRRVTPSR
jgi:hypothetical protein